MAPGARDQPPSLMLITNTARMLVWNSLISNHPPALLSRRPPTSSSSSLPICPASVRSAQMHGGEWESDLRSVGATFIGSNTSGDHSWQAYPRHRCRSTSRFAWENLGARATRRMTVKQTPVGATHSRRLTVEPRLQETSEDAPCRRTTRSHGTKEFVNSLPGSRPREHGGNARQAQGALRELKTLNVVNSRRNSGSMLIEPASAPQKPPGNPGRFK